MVEPDLKPAIQGKRRAVSDFVEGTAFVRFIVVLILINAVTLGLETNKDIMASYGSIVYVIDKSILAVFVFELLLKFYAYRLGFFKSGWNVFDFIIVGIAVLPASGSFAVLRSLRILRVLRLLSVVPQMRRVISAIGYSIPGMMSVISVLLIIFYVSAVLATKLFGMHPDPQMQEWFGTIGASGYTLFQIMTLESWSMGIVRPTMEIYPLAWIFFVPFIIITSFAVLNLFIGIIVDAMQMVQVEPREQDKAEIKEFTRDELQEIHKRFDLLQKEIQDLKK
ncbi:MAG: ion transporter [Alphaproteobacteria bacterium]|nr:ion transporter [Alphaproteobacteria bacterium]NCQ87725.1 ion transporter [Alphaproteobacteria bacterium]NCT05766.1 ion transporter [Alphaproteobacteria bacterium]